MSIHAFSSRHLLAVVGLVLSPFLGCSSPTLPPEHLSIPGYTQLGWRETQSRKFEKDKAVVLKGVVNTLLDYGYILDSSNGVEGQVSASKGQNPKINISIDVGELQDGAVMVRISIQFDKILVEDIKYYEEFFSALDYTLFVSLHLDEEVGSVSDEDARESSGRPLLPASDTVKGRPDASRLLEMSNGEMLYKFKNNKSDNKGTASLSLNDQGVYLLVDYNNPQRAASGRELLMKAAQGGDDRAAYNLGIAYSLGLGGGIDWAEAATWFGQAATRGHTGAQYRLGLLYLEGKGVAWDVVKAGEWFIKAAESNHVYAQYQLGRLYEDGRGLPQDIAMTVQLFEKAAKGGHREAAYRLGLIHDQGNGVRRDPKKAVYWHQQAAKSGFKEAQFQLAFAYERGIGITRDVEQALDWYHKAAEGGHIPSQNNAAVLMASLRKDYKGAMYWLQRAADQNHSKAQNNLGMLYLSGISGLRNNVLAYFWFSVSAAGGEGGALENRNFTVSRMSPAQLVEAEKLFRDWRVGFDLAELPKIQAAAQVQDSSEGGSVAAGTIGLSNMPPVMMWPPGRWPAEILNPDQFQKPAAPKGNQKEGPGRFND